MSKLRCHISISADGFVAGPNQSEENPLGEGGERLHDWVVPLAAWRESHAKQGGEVNPSSRIVEEARENVGAGVMGRNMFGPPAGGDWDDEWIGWWGAARWPPRRGGGAGRGGGGGGGATPRRTTTTCSSSPITRASRSR